MRHPVPQAEGEEKTIQAAGGVVYRKVDGGYQTILVGSGDPIEWRLPKGILEEGESLARTAIREVREEAGVLAAVEEEIGVTSWEYQFQGRVWVKRTTFFLMPFIAGARAAKDMEYEFVQWVTLLEARTLIRYNSERSILLRAEKRLTSKFRRQARESQGEQS
jgi:8-oxo-dGTP pyrophosphatase MutT (NUDIX family)